MPGQESNRSAKKKKTGQSKKKQKTSTVSPPRTDTGTVPVSPAENSMQSQHYHHVSPTPSIGDNCLTCRQPVDEDAVAMQCSICGRFIHLSCDDNMNHELYTMMNKYPSNPLLYPCFLCKPKIGERVQLQDFVGKAISRLDSVIGENHKSQEFQMDMLVKAVTARIGALESLTSDVGDSVGAFNDKIQSLTDHVSRNMNTNLEAVDDKIRTLTSVVDRFQSSLPIHPAPTADQTNQASQTLEPNRSNNSVNQNSAPPPSLMSLQQQPGWYPLTQHGNQIQNPPNHFRPPPIPPPMSNMPPYSHMPPNYTRYRGPPLANINHPQPPNPETSLVLYNIRNDKPPNEIVADIANECEIPLSEITGVKQLPTTRALPPIAVTLSSKASKWCMIKLVNTYNDVYAKPFLSAEERKQDQKLVRLLKQLRRKNPENLLKIKRGEIHIVDGATTTPFCALMKPKPPTEQTTDSF